jgi:hypothetical protein
LAVQVTAQAVENEDRQTLHEQTSNISVTRQLLERLRQSVCEGALQGAIVSATEQVRRLRFQKAVQAFIMHRLDVDYSNDHDAVNNNYTSKNSTGSTQTPLHPALRRRQHARGIGKIGGLPLPHAGPELYGVLPPRELQSALRLVASLTCTVARCLAIVLPHPILLKPNGGVGDIIDTVPLQPKQASSPQKPLTTTSIVNHQKADPVGSSSTSSIMSLMEMTTSSFWGRSAKNALARATGQTIPEDGSFRNASSSSSMVAVVPPPTTASPTPTDSPAIIAQRLLHATCAVLAEDSKSASSSSRYALSQSVMHQEEFAIALQLLQNNVIALCIRAGVPVNHLFPAEAMLLNLHALATYCQEQVVSPW